MTDRRAQSKGYSLVELLVAAGIIAAMATISVASLGNFLKKDSLATTASAVANAVREARSRTLASVKGQQYGVKIDADRFTFFAGAAFSTSTADDPYVFPSGVRASTLIPTIVFSRVTGNTTASGTISLYIPGFAGVQKTVGVQGTGLVNIF